MRFCRSILAASALTAALAVATAAPAAGRLRPPVAAGDHDFHLTVGGVTRRYLVHVPPGYDGRIAVPVVMMLHGGGGTSRAAATETGWGAKADQVGFLAVFPDALPPNPAKRSSFARNPQLWNDGSERFYTGQNAVDDVGFLNAVLDEVSVRFAVDARRVFVTGFSNGGSMTFRFAAEASTRLAAIAPVAGACWVEPQGLEWAVPMLYITGTADPLNLIEGGVPRLLNGGSDTVRAKAKPPVRDSILKWGRASGCPEKPPGVSEGNGVRTETYGPGRNRTEVVYISMAGSRMART
jgi:polyhydroxybutyrate depolymerase